MKPETPDVSDRWLAPSAALSRFTPPEGAMIGMRQPVEARRARFGFRVGELRLLIKPDARSEVMMQTSISSFPNMPEWFVGVMNLRGNLVPVFDVRLFLEAGESDLSKRTTVLVFDQGSDMVGMIIDGLPQSVTLGAVLQSTPPLPEAIQESVDAAYMIDDMVWLDFDHQKFFAMLGGQVAG